MTLSLVAAATAVEDRLALGVLEAAEEAGQLRPWTNRHRGDEHIFCEAKPGHPRLLS
jgi:hypothetical protein